MVTIPQLHQPARRLESGATASGACLRRAHSRYWPDWTGRINSLWRPDRGLQADQAYKAFSMNARTHAVSLILMVVFGLMAGCGKEEHPAAASTDGAAPGAASKRSPADRPDAAVLAVVEGLKADHPEAFWDFLP